MDFCSMVSFNKSKNIDEADFVLQGQIFLTLPIFIRFNRKQAFSI